MADYWSEYVWMVVVGALLAFFMAYGIGANDVANAFATSVGSKTLTLMQALCIAAVCEFGGAILLGRGVTDTIKSSIVDRECFEYAPELLMYGMLCALAAAGCWLLLATYLEMAVSTTHSIIGAVIGFGLVAGGSDCIQWYEYDSSETFPIKGVTAVVLSWLISPVCSGIVSAIFFLAARHSILRYANSFQRAYFALPILIFICIFINAFYVLDKGVSKQAESVTTEMAAWIAAIIGAASLVIGGAISYWLYKRDSSAPTAAEISDKEADLEKGGDVESKASNERTSSFFARAYGSVADRVNANDPHADADAAGATKDIHDNAEVFDPRTEGVFRYLQVLTACCDSFAHGANDVANSIGPFSAIWAVYTTGSMGKKAEIPIWILVIGGVGIVVGLGTYGYGIIKALGVKMAKITPARGFSIELGSALIVVTGSYFGLPLSTTHCQVGSTAAVGLCEGSRGVSWPILLKTAVGWVLTLVIVGFMSALLMAQGIYSPSRNMARTIDTLHSAIEASGTAQAESLAVCTAGAFPANLDTAVRVLNGASTEDLQHPNRAAAALEYMTQLHITSTTVTCPVNFAPVPADLAALYPPVEEEEEE